MDSDLDRPIKYRNMILQVILMVVTLGIYGIYWYYQTASELKALAKDPNAAPTLWTVFLFIPFANIYAYYKHSELYEKVSGEHLNRWILFLLWIVFSPAVWFIVQMELNKRATVGRPLS